MNRGLYAFAGCSATAMLAAWANWFPAPTTKLRRKVMTYHCKTVSLFVMKTMGQLYHPILPSLDTIESEAPDKRRSSFLLLGECLCITPAIAESLILGQSFGPLPFGL